MKKILLVLALSFFSSVAWANTFEGIIKDNESSAPLKKVAIFVDDNQVKPLSDKDGEFSFKAATAPDIHTLHKTYKLRFELDKYITLEGTLTTNQGKLIYNDVRFGNVKLKTPANGGVAYPDPGAFYTLPEIKMALAPVLEPIISGLVLDGKENPMADVLVSGTVKIDGTSENFAEITTEKDGTFVIMGFTNKKSKYSLSFDDKKDRYVKQTDKVSLEANATKDDYKITLNEKSARLIREENLEKITGFGCNELMPRYLVGASCTENSNLEGDATDIAVWIQKFGSKITGMIGMIAVVLIVWNAFNLVTAAGETEKISQAKKGIMWTILGLAVTMFAYIIVKTVIMLAYTS